MILMPIPALNFPHYAPSDIVAMTSMIKSRTATRDKVQSPCRGGDLLDYIYLTLRNLFSIRK